MIAYFGLKYSKYIVNRQPSKNMLRWFYVCILVVIIHHTLMLQSTLTNCGDTKPVISLSTQQLYWPLFPNLRYFHSNKSRLLNKSMQKWYLLDYRQPSRWRTLAGVYWKKKPCVIISVKKSYVPLLHVTFDRKSVPCDHHPITQHMYWQFTVLL